MRTSRSLIGGMYRNEIGPDKDINDDSDIRALWREGRKLCSLDYTVSHLNRITAMDGAAIFLLRVSAFTINIETWMRLANYHEVVRTSTAIIIFATKISSLRKTGLGLNHAYKFDMNTLRVYLQINKQVPKPMNNTQKSLLISKIFNWS